nr:SIMPL domain-containing protein [Bartonella apis]
MNKTEPVIVVQATGDEQAKPDIAIINLAVETEGETADSALNANNGTMNKVLDAFKKDGIENADLMTSGLAIYRVEENKKANTPLYRVSNSLSVRVRDINKAGKIFDEAMKLGVNSVNGITFTNADTKPYLTNARKKAVAEAIAKAKTLAESANVKLGNVITIAEDNSGNMMMPRLMSASATAYRNETNFSSGELDYKVNVTMTFAIEQ